MWKSNTEVKSTAMNLNNFVFLSNKPKSVKLNVKNLHELCVEMAQLSQDNKDMESRLHQLREVMSHEKEEREKDGAFHWKSSQAQDWTRDKEKNHNKSALSKMKIRVLKDELLPLERVPEPPHPKDGWRRKSRLKGKACGQCEARIAGLVCAECAEDYCTGCFTKFHRKGALRFHHIIPLKAELHTSVNTLDMVNHFHKKTESEEKANIWTNHIGDEGTDPECRATSILLQAVSDEQIHRTQVLYVNHMDGENENSLLRGNFDEEESSRSFQQALHEWRAGNTHGDIEQHEPNHNLQTAQPASMEVRGTQAGGRSPICIEFKVHGLSYMERLLLKQHRRKQIEPYQLLSCPRTPQDPKTDTCTQPVEDTNETHELTAEDLELHQYCVSLFTISNSEAEELNNILKSCLSITEIDEAAGDTLMNASLGSMHRDDQKVNQGGDALAMLFQAEQHVLHPTTPLDFSLKTQTELHFSQSPPSDPLLSSLTFHKLQKFGDISTLTSSEIINAEQHVQEALLPKLIRPQLSRCPSKTKSTLKCTRQVWDPCMSISFSSQSQCPLIYTSNPCQLTLPLSTNLQLEEEVSILQSSAEQSSSDNKEQCCLPSGLSSSKSEILHLSSSNSDLSDISDSIGMIPTNEAAPDEEMWRSSLQEMEEEEERNTQSFPPIPFSSADVPFLSQSPTTEEQSGLFNNLSLVVSSLVQRHNTECPNYQGLDGFFTLGLDSKFVPLSLAPAHAPSEIYTQMTNSEAFMSGDTFWRPKNRLRNHAEEKANQPSISQSVTLFSKKEPSQRQSALEILEVQQGVQQAENTHIKQDEEDVLTITSLEEELKQLNPEPN